MFITRLVECQKGLLIQQWFKANKEFDPEVQVHETGEDEDWMKHIQLCFHQVFCVSMK